MLLRLRHFLPQNPYWLSTSYPLLLNSLAWNSRWLIIWPHATWSTTTYRVRNERIHETHKHSVSCTVEDSWVLSTWFLVAKVRLLSAKHQPTILLLPVTVFLPWRKTSLFPFPVPCYVTSHMVTGDQGVIVPRHRPWSADRRRTQG